MDKKLIRKNEIIDASIGIMYLKGYNGTSVKDLTDAAGIPKGSFYHYFDGKESYAVDAIHYYAQMGQTSFALLMDKDLEPLDRIRAFYKNKIDILLENKSLNGCFVGNLTEEVGSVNLSIGEAVEQFHHNLETLIVNNLLEAKATKAYSNDVDCHILASYIVSTWQGTLLRGKVKDKEKYFRNFMIILNENLLR